MEAYAAVRRVVPAANPSSAKEAIRPAEGGWAPGPDLAAAEAIARIPFEDGSPTARGPDAVSPERAELIRRAMELHAAKQGVLAELDEDSRRKLVAVALRAFFHGRSKT